MGRRPAVELQELFADSFRRALTRMSAREQFAELLASAGLIGANAAIWLIQPPDSFSVLTAAVCWLALVLATLVRFDTPFGFTVPTQLAFVPLLFALPMALVPIAVAAALITARLWDVVRGRAQLTRVLHMFPNAWFAVGPAAVFALAGTAPSRAGAGLLLLALVAQFAGDFIVCSVRVAIERSATFSAQLGESWVYMVDAALSGIGLVVAEQLQRSGLAALAVLPLLAVLAGFARERRQRIESLIELNNAYRGTALVLGDVVEADDNYTGKHSRSVVALCLAVGDRLGLPAGACRNLEFGALLHDVGKIAIPKEIIQKPGKLDPQEWRIIQTHTVLGEKMLAQVGGFMRQVGRIVRSHHERWDGSGYPDGLAGEAIPLESRIIACCDAWNAMRTDRPYRKALSVQTALAELHKNAGSQFDPRILDTLVEVIHEEPQASGSEAIPVGPGIAPEAPAVAAMPAVVAG